MPWYRTGTATFTNGSTTVTGSGTAWVANGAAGQGILGPDGRLYEVAAINADAQLTLASSFLGSTTAGAAYALLPTQDYIRALAAQVATLINDYNAVKNNAGAGKFPPGNAAAPGVAATTDTDTGLHWNAGANVLGLAAGGAGQVRVLGVGGANREVTLSGSSGGAPQIGTTAGDLDLRPSSATVKVSGPFSTFVAIDRPAGHTGGFDFRSGGVGRWSIAVTSAAESGGNNGSDYGIASFNDAGGYLELPLQVVRSSGIMVTKGIQPNADNVRAIGNGAARYSVVFAATGTINTSDARTKTPLDALTPGEVAAACQLAAEIGSFKFLVSVAEKGDAARTHVGLTVQRAIEIMQAHGLDPMRYAFICHDQWSETVRPAVTRTEPPVIESVPAVIGAGGDVLIPETQRVVTPARDVVLEPELVTPAGDRYGFRVDQLLLFIARGQAARQDALEARIAALEGHGGNAAGVVA